ncbi:ABC transporter substrate-binding protein [Pseudoalteromonas fenneropenaei]|uniref:ABC transporter substrate-binding protein n=1 Tax=Pseudoalteromonas fenneropenaei TaxID=1737459 RepID=A0ABV7CLU6_9GAMM
MLVLSLAAISCSSDHPSYLRVAANTWIGYTPLYLADDMRLFEPDLIHLVEMSSASEVIHAFRSGAIEVAALTLDEAMTVLEDDFDIQVILVLDISNGSDVLLAKPDIPSIAALKGKTIAVEYSAVGALVLDSALKKAGLTPADITIRSCTLDDHAACYQQTDALVTFDPMKTHLLEQGAKILFSSAQMPNLIVDVLVTHRQVIKEQPQQLQQLINHYFAARTKMTEAPEESWQTLERLLKIPTRQLHQASLGITWADLALNQHFLASAGGIHTTLAELKHTMLTRKLLKRPLNTDAFINDQFVKQYANQQHGAKQ